MEKFKETDMKDKKTNEPKPLPIRPAYMGAVSEAQLEVRRQAGMLSFMRKRDQQEDWG